MHDIQELNNKLVGELKEIAKDLDVPKFDKLKKQDLIYQILDFQAMKKHDENDNTESEEEDEDENDESSEFRQRSVYELQDGVMAAHGVNMGAYY